MPKCMETVVLTELVCFKANLQSTCVCVLALLEQEDLNDRFTLCMTVPLTVSNAKHDPGPGQMYMFK